MSWLGGSISSLTGQLSNLTKDILTEGTEEVTDHLTELRIAQEKITEYQSIISSQKSENERLRRINHELEEKAESAELQINSISREYRSLLEEKEKEVNSLKQSHQEILSHQLSPAPYDGDPQDHAHHPQDVYSGGDFGEDHLDFGDNISMQHEINRLTKEVRRLQTEIKHWKSQVNPGEVKQEKADDGKENADLKKRINELEDQLRHEREDRQHEVATLQDVHAQKMATLRKKLKTEISQYKETIMQLEEQVQKETTDGNKADVSAEEVDKLKQELNDKDTELSALRLEHEKVCSGLRTTKFRLLDLLDANHAQSLDLLCDIHELRRQMNSGIKSRREAFLQEKQDLVNQMITSGSELKELRGTVEALECEQEKVTMETDSIVENLGSTEHQELTKGIMDSLEKENLVLKKRNLEQQEQITLLERAMKTVNEERVISESSRSQGDGESRGSMETTDADVQSLTSDLSILTNRNKELDTEVSDLKQQISKYEQEIEQFELVKSDWISEKEALEGVLVQLRDQLREKENSLNIIEAQKGLEEAQKQGRKNLSKQKDNNRELIKEDNQDYGSESELSSNGDIGEDIQKLDQQVELLTQANAELENERDALLKDKLQLEQEVLSLKDEGISGKNNTLSPDLVSKLETEIENLKKENLALEATIKECRGLETLLADRDKEIDELQEEKNALEQSLEELDSQHQEAMEQVIKIRNDLQKNVQDLRTEICDKSDKISELQQEVVRYQKREKASEAEAKRFDELEEELFTMRDRNEELETSLKKLQAQTGEGKNQESGEKLNKMEEKVKSLNKIVNEKDSELKDLKKKLQNGALALNDLHMDIKDLEKQVSDKQKIIDEKSEKLKKLREEKEELSSSVKHLETQIKSSEVLVNSLQKTSNESDEQIKLQAHIDSLQQQLHEKSEEMNSVVSELEGVNTHLADYMERYTKLQMENSDLLCKVSERDNQLREIKESVKNQVDEVKQEYQDKLDVMQGEKSSLEKEVEELKESMEARVKDCIQEIDSQLEVMRSEKLSMEREVKQLEQTMEDKVRHYESYIQDLQNSQEMDVSTIQQEHQKLMQEAHEKDLEMTRLEGEVNTLKSYLEEAEEGVRLKEEQTQTLSGTIAVKDTEVKSLKEEVAEITEERDKLMSMLQELEGVSKRKEQLELEAVAVKEENSSLQKEIEELQESIREMENESSEKELNKSVVTQLEAELSLANGRITDLENQCEKQRETILGQERTIEDLDRKNSEQGKQIREEALRQEQQEESIVILQQSITSKEEEVSVLQRKLDRATSTLEKDKQVLVQEEDLAHPVHVNGENMKEDPEKGVVEVVQQEEVMEEMVVQTVQNNYTAVDGEVKEKTSGMSDEHIVQQLEDLQALLQDKDQVIAELQKNNASVLKMLEAKSLTLGGDKTLVDVHRLEGEVRNLKIEKEQILAVMNEKSREASNLKSEVHRLMNVISAEKVALEKLQQDNNELTRTREKEKSPVEEMQKEALQNLSRIIRDKDVEIEALRQKNDTLLAVLQESPNNEGDAGQLSGLMQDKENLTKQLSALQSEREQMITYLNQKHQESIAYHNEIQRLTAYINTETEQNQQVKQDYANLVPQFEDKKQALLKAQNDLINHKQKFTELELKYGELLQRTNASETIDMTSYNAKVEEVKNLQQSQQELMESLKDKEHKIQVCYQQSSEFESSIQKRDSEISNLKKQIESLSFNRQELESRLSDLSSEHSVSEQQSHEQTSQLHILKETNNRLTLALQEKEFELTSLTEKCRTFSELLESKAGEESQVNRMMAENENILQQARQIQQERDQAIMALKQRQIENDEMSKEILKLREKDVKSTRELDRLRAHLLQVEEGYTREALEAEEREKDLRTRLTVAEERLLTSSSAIETVNQQASLQTESLQQQLRTLATQRDQAYLQVSGLQDQVQQYAASLTNLQMVLEQFQQEKESQVSLEIEHYQKEVVTLKEKVAHLSNELAVTKENLQQAEEGLEAASRLSEQLDRKEEAILALKEEVLDRERALAASEEKMKDLQKMTDGKVDKLVVRNLLLGYLTTSKDKQPVALRAVGGVLGFTEEDFLKVSSPGKSWMPGFLRFGSAPPVTPTQTPPTTPIRTLPPGGHSTPRIDKSFSELFVKFLEAESTPTQTMRLPAEEMVKEVQRQKESYKPTHNPFTAPRHVAMPTGGHDTSLQRGSPILMSNTPVSPTINLFTPSFPSEFTSVQASSTRTSNPNTSSAILKDVLGSR